NLASTNNRNLGNTPAETQRNTKLVERNNQDYARIDKSKGEDFLITGTILTAATIYTAIVGDGNPVDGLETIGQGSDPLSKVITQGVQAGIELSYEHFPDKTQNTLDFIAKVGNDLDATVKYVDDKTGNVVSVKWNKLDKDTQNQIKGGGKILSIVIPGSSIKTIKKLANKNNLINKTPRPLNKELDAQNLYKNTANKPTKPTKPSNRKVVVGPNGGKGTYTGKYDKNNNPIIKRESGGYYVKDPKTGKQQAVKSPNEHGNTLGNQPTERYKLIDRETNKPLKSGETTHGELRYGASKQKRYTDKELDNMGENGAEYKQVEIGTKKQMYDKQNQVLKRYKDRYGEYPPLNKNGR
ncbi:hypothetical protein BPUTSESOX_563, partial [uncultured Gammaproteobacteria bacterium]